MIRSSCSASMMTGASHDTSYSYVDYYQNDPDLVRINHLPFYMGKNEEGNDYPSQILLRQHFGISLPGTDRRSPGAL